MRRAVVIEVETSSFENSVRGIFKIQIISSAPFELIFFKLFVYTRHGGRKEIHLVLQEVLNAAAKFPVMRIEK